MAKFTKRMVLVLWVLTLCIGLLGMTVCAANSSASATIEVNTALSGDLPEAPDTFTLVLTPDKAGWPMPEGSKDGVYTMTLQGAASLKFQLDFDRVGVYRYTVKQLPGTNPDCYLDSGVYHITVYVTSGEKDGELYVSVVLSRDGAEQKQEKITFSNRYATAAQVTLAATKTLDKKTPKDGKFSFQLKDEKGNVLETVENIGGDVKFSTLPYTSEGTFTYTISEVVGKDSKIVYDKTKYTAVVTVKKDDNGDYQAEVVYKLGDKTLAGKPAFANKTKTGSVQTGDSSNLGLWILLLLLSACALFGIWYWGKEKEVKVPEAEQDDLTILPDPESE